MHYSIMTTTMTLRRLGCALCMPFISPFRSPFQPYNRAYAYRGLTTFASLSMAVSSRFNLASTFTRLAYVAVRTPPMSLRLLTLTEQNG
ncbi:MAG: hypothetical protein KZQ60_12885 [Candidatus Thiodiazotropha sp. (ex Lucinoma aequizonata)]|nr:hypothetical protein [Candidatus Thiodiazotropha sp. (ex Lucinoma aequizonata)]